MQDDHPHQPNLPLYRLLILEGCASAFFVLAVVGASSAAERLTDDPALMAAVSALSAAGVLYALMSALGPWTGGHVNPIVTFAYAMRGRVSPWRAAAYMGVQYLGALTGALISLAFDLERIAEIAAREAAGAGWEAEAVATFGLTLVACALSERGRAGAPAALAVFAGASHLFTLSHSFANPAMTFAQSFTPSPAGIDAGAAFSVFTAQFIASLLAVGMASLLPRELLAAAQPETDPNPHEAPRATAPQPRKLTPRQQARAARSGPVAAPAVINPTMQTDLERRLLEMKSRLAAEEAKVAREQALQKREEEKRAAARAAAAAAGVGDAAPAAAQKPETKGSDLKSDRSARSTAAAKAAAKSVPSKPTPVDPPYVEPSATERPRAKPRSAKVTEAAASAATPKTETSPPPLERSADAPATGASREEIEARLAEMRAQREKQRAARIAAAEKARKGRAGGAGSAG